VILLLILLLVESVIKYSIDFLLNLVSCINCDLVVALKSCSKCDFVPCSTVIESSVCASFCFNKNL